MFHKFGEAITVTASDIQSTESVISDPEILNRFKKFANELKSIAPMAKDFLYFSAIMMHAAEAAILDESGNVKIGSDGQPIKCGWDKKGDSLKWWCSDSSIKPYKNSNSDIFPENELIAAHKKWVGRPLCLDHKSSSVDMIRGVIVDTFYDRKNKRVIALCALDKVNYPDLARKVSTGYATSVSMGTAVGKAICTDCGTVAKVEADFCTHMRNKNCYGEINTDLNPIELSIVVNGADPKAKIRHIVAAANNLAKYIETKETTINKMAGNEVTDGLAEVKDELSAIMKKVKNLLNQAKDLEESNEEDDEDEEESEEDANDVQANPDYPEKSPYGLTSSSKEMREINTDEHDTNSAPGLGGGFSANPEARIFSEKNMAATINKMAYRLEQLQQQFQNLTKNYDKEQKMTTRKTAYYQGGGGLNDPNALPYDKEDSDSIRDGQDKQMVGKMDTGPVDGMYPGDKELKAQLQRAASAAERAERRELALAAAKANLLRLKNAETNKQAYHQGGGGDNEPTPGKTKYTPDPLAMQARKEDKQMVGEKPFPDVGNVDGLYGDDLATKQKLSRAGLKAKFIKAANPDGSDNLGQSRWQVYAGDKLILTATVNEISGGKVAALYDAIATKDFGGKILETIKTAGFDVAASMFKGAQAEPSEEEVKNEAAAQQKNKKPSEDFVKKYPNHKLSKSAMRRNAQTTPAPAAAPGPAMPADAGGAAPAPGEMPAEPPAGAEGEETPADEGTAGDPQARVKELANKAKELGAQVVENADDLIEAVSAMRGEQPQLATVKEMGEEGAPPPPSPEAGKASTASLQSMRKTLNGALSQGMKEVVANLRDVHEELSLISHLYGTGKIARASAADKQVASSLVTAAFQNAHKVLADSRKLMAAFVKYARGTEALVKRAAEEKKFAKFAKMHSDPSVDELVDMDLGLSWDSDDGVNMSDDENMDMDNVDEGMNMADDNSMVEDDGMSDDDNMGDDLEFEPLKSSASKKSGRNALMNSLKAVAEASSSAPDLTTKAGRAEYRAKLAAKGMEFSDMLDKAHPKGGFTTQLDTKPEGDLAHVEDLKEQHEAMMDVANAPPRVKKAAADIQKLVVSGKLAAEDVDGLAAFGVDSDAIKYWKSFYGEAKDGGSQFAADLVKEYGEVKKKAEMDAYQVKIARAYQLAYDMADRNLISREASAIREQVEEIMKFPDEGFESLKRTVAKFSSVGLKKEASIPQVGLIGSGDITMPMAGETSEGVDLKSALEGAFSNRRY